jgi:hypothetical protein
LRRGAEEEDDDDEDDEEEEVEEEEEEEEVCFDEAIEFRLLLRVVGASCVGAGVAELGSVRAFFATGASASGTGAAFRFLGRKVNPSLVSTVS